MATIKSYKCSQGRIYYKKTRKAVETKSNIICIYLMGGLMSIYILDWLRFQGHYAEIQKKIFLQNGPDFLLREVQSDDAKFTPFKRSCGIDELANAYFEGYNPTMAFEIYDGEFTEKHLKIINGRKIWTL